MPESAQTTAAAPSAAQPDVKTLFRRWRSGDADAGLAMAQRFSDWYYAITVMRLGDARARAPLQRACQAFADRIMEITEPENLVDFAHQLVLDEIGATESRAPGGDFPNAITRHRSPSQLLQQAGRALPADQLRLLHRVYSERGGAAAGEEGLPHAALKARHSLKRWLSENADVPFAVLPRQAILDRAPMPLYEAARLASPEEERLFEQWLLEDLDLCKDVAEFASFSHALRAGALAELASQQPATPAPRPDALRGGAPPDAARPTPALPQPDAGGDLEPAAPRPAATGGGNTGMIIGGLLIAGLIAGAILLYLLLKG